MSKQSGNRLSGNSQSGNAKFGKTQPENAQFGKTPPGNASSGTRYPGLNGLMRRIASGVVAGVLFAGLAGVLPLACAHEGHEHGSAAASAKKAKRTELGISAAVDAQGRLWIVSKQSGAAGDHVVVRHSSDEGKTWSAALRVNAKPEPVAAPGEERPRILTGSKNQLYVVWTRPGSKNYAGDIRFAASPDAGASWSVPVTVQQYIPENGQPVSHRHPVVTEDGNGLLYVAWIDRRDVERAKVKGETHPGASAYYAVSDNGGKSWRGDYQLSNATCDCCRLALQTGSDGVPVAFWRQVFANSERDHALARLTPDGRNLTLARATQDQWQVEACPDHGPSLALTGQTRHAVWFDMVQQNGMVFYGRLTNAPESIKIEGLRTLPDGAEHADIVASGDAVWVAWQRFDGQQNSIGTMTSTDGGQNWREATVASSRGAVDQPRLVLQGKRAFLIWNTAEQGLLVRKL